MNPSNDSELDRQVGALRSKCEQIIEHTNGLHRCLSLSAVMDYEDVLHDTEGAIYRGYALGEIVGQDTLLSEIDFLREYVQRQRDIDKFGKEAVRAAEATGVLNA